MEENNDIAKGFTKRDKTLVDSLWQDLAAKLNGAGPPNKDVTGWKKVWTDCKSDVKKKLSHNKIEERAIRGGGPYAKHTLSSIEEAIVRVCSMDQAVTGVAGIALGEEQSLSPFSAPQKRMASSDTPVTAKKPRADSSLDKLTGCLKNTEKLNELTADIAETLKENSSNTKKVYRSIDRISTSLDNMREDFQNFSVKMLNALKEKNELKKQQLEIEI